MNVSASHAVIADRSTADRLLHRRGTTLVPSAEKNQHAKRYSGESEFDSEQGKPKSLAMLFDVRTDLHDDPQQLEVPTPTRHIKSDDFIVGAASGPVNTTLSKASFAQSQDLQHGVAPNMSTQDRHGPH